MKLKALIKKLQKIEEKHGNLDCVVDMDDNGYYNLENVKAEEDMEDERVGQRIVVNLRSSNES
jgi:hypothetical protein